MTGTPCAVNASAPIREADTEEVLKLTSRFSLLFFTGSSNGCRGATLGPISKTEQTSHGKLRNRHLRNG
jgi:hypothetical protein